MTSDPEPSLAPASISGPQSLGEILSRPAVVPRPLIEGGLLHERTKMILYGRYKSLKSMLGLDMALCLAMGQPWLDFKVPSEGISVLYLQLEISYALFRSRLSKAWSWRSQLGELKKPLHFWTEHWMKLDQRYGFDLLDKQMDELQPDLLVVDPLYKVVSGNLLTAQDVQRVIDQLDVLIGRYGTSVVLISHTRKGLMDMGEWGSDDLIGSVFFSAWADTILKLERRGGDRLQLKFDVVRHAEEELEPKEVVFNRDTLELTVVQPLVPTQTPETKESETT